MLYTTGFQPAEGDFTSPSGSPSAPQGRVLRTFLFIKLRFKGGSAPRYPPVSYRGTVGTSTSSHSSLDRSSVLHRNLPPCSLSLALRLRFLCNPASRSISICRLIFFFVRSPPPYVGGSLTKKNISLRLKWTAKRVQTCARGLKAQVAGGWPSTARKSF